MKFAVATLPLVLALVVDAIPIKERGFSDIGSLDEVVLFDSPAFQDEAGNTLVNVESYVFLKQFDISPLSSLLGDALEKIGLGDVGDKIDVALDRLSLLATIGMPGKVVKMKVSGCDKEATLPKTSLGDLGLVTGVVSVGKCGTNNSFSASVQGDDFSSDVTIFPSGSDGFGVISDIDDTIKISNVLDKVKLAKATLFDDPTPVPGMPELYKSLATSLSKPQFIYISGSPYQLYPFLREFVATSFPDSRGPLFLRNLTITDLDLILDSFSEDANKKLEYKLSQIARVQAMYPSKSFLSIGDSTEKDPEIYGQAFKTHGGDFIRCIWIHVVDGADNSDARFAAAFEGVPQERVRLFNDSQISALADVDVAGGQC
ncbi:hypothetical protein V5O48_009405 [Marasmius crinis-equi]|uniref:Phosphatidate phosphatase APP1 catalytic domain-containing protein n=1 Tax=Marasmius crinis-equi TaxID=585013 RepID=A0ABR3FBI8_9AGAR